MGLKLRDLVGLLKDKASISKALLLSRPSTISLHLALLRATSHEPSNPPDTKHVTAILSYGHISQNTASTCIESLIDRLHNTRNSSVAFKSLIIIHNVIKQGSFVLLDKLSVYPSVGGRNYLNLSSFQDNTTTEAINLSFWVRWYARVLETFIFTSRNLGFFLSPAIKKDGERVSSSLVNQDLLKELNMLVSLVEEICKVPELLHVQENRLVHEAISLVHEDRSSAQREIMVRVNEIIERVDTLSFGESDELVCVLRRYENCKDKLQALFFNRKNTLADLLWELVAELKDKIGKNKEHWSGKLGRIVVSESAKVQGRIGAGGGSAGFGDLVFRRDDSVRCRSGGLVVRMPMPVLIGQ